ncbi:resolvase, partial [Salmonella enterica]|nr:resolvase [Salmonella enterica]
VLGCSRGTISSAIKRKSRQSSGE